MLEAYKACKTYQSAVLPISKALESTNYHSDTKCLRAVCPQGAGGYLLTTLV